MVIYSITNVSSRALNLNL